MHSSRSWRRNIQSVSRCCMKPRRSWRTWGTGTTLLERPDASIPSACTPWWGTLCVHLCVCACVCVYMKSSFSRSQVFVLQDSLAAEIEGTMRKELSLDDPECEEQKYVWTTIGQRLYVIYFTSRVLHRNRHLKLRPENTKLIWYWFLWGFHIAQGMSIHIHFDDWTIFIGAFVVPRGWILLTVVILWLYF